MNEDKITKMALIDIELGYLMNVVSQKLFKANAVMDCISSRMDTVFGMPKASEILHHRIAHKFPLLADIITEYLGKRNYAVYYGLIPQIDYRYDKPSEYFWEFVNMMGDIRDDINKAIEMAEKVKDYSASDVLASFLSEHIDLYTKQAFILYYQSLQEEEHGNLSSFNSHFEDLMIITE